MMILHRQEEEKEEQSIVTEFILVRKLKKITEEEVKTKGPVTKEAGRLKHLLTVFTLRSHENGLWQRVAKALHPYPCCRWIAAGKIP
jgi:hypothetical protein